MPEPLAPDTLKVEPDSLRDGNKNSEIAQKQTATSSEICQEGNSNHDILEARYAHRPDRNILEMNVSSAVTQEYAVVMKMKKQRRSDLA